MYGCNGFDVSAGFSDCGDGRGCIDCSGIAENAGRADFADYVGFDGLSLVAARGRSWPLVAARGRSWPLVAARGRSWPLVAARGRSWQVVAGRGRSWQVVAGRGRSWQVVAARGRSWQVVAARFPLVFRSFREFFRFSQNFI